MAKVLVLTSRWPFPPYGGDKNRILEICRELAKYHQVVLVAASESGVVAPPGAEAMLFSKLVQVVIPRWNSYLNCAIGLLGRLPLQLRYYWSRHYQREVNALLEDADVVVAHLIRTAQYVRSDFAGLKVLELTDAASLNLMRGRQPGRVGRMLSLIYAVEYARVQRYERHCLDAFDVVSLVSDVDRQYLAQIHGESRSRMVVATLGIDKSRFSSAPRAPGPVVAFLGNMQTLPNIDACDFFIRECLPLVHESVPEVIFRIIGPIPDRVRTSLLAGSTGVEIVGEVDDLAAAMRGVFCAVAPMRRGAGIQTKILDYMALAVPAVVTDIANEGLTATVGRDLLLANSAQAIAQAVVMLKARPDLAAGIGAAGQSYAASHHGWSECLRPIVEAIGSVADRTSG